MSFEAVTHYSKDFFQLVTSAVKITKRRVLMGAALLAATVLFFLILGAVTQKHRDQVYNELTKFFGSDVTLDSVETHLWKGIGFSLKNFQIADDPQFAATPFVHATDLQLGVSLWNLLRGRLVIDSLTFIQPEFQFITNEDGLLNVAALMARRKELAGLEKARPGEKRSSVAFQVTRVRVVDGRVDLIDRSVNAPAELRVKNIELDIGGLGIAARGKIRLAASLTEGLGQDLRIQGEMGPLALDGGWTQQPVNLEMRFDSLYLPMLARAVPFLRNRIPRELDITGPMYFQTKLTGTLGRPRFSDITLKVPFLGSSEYNAVLEGNTEFPDSRDWGDAPISGRLTLNAISLAQLRKLPLLRQTLPDAFATGGTVNIRSRFAGTWNELRVGAVVNAAKSELFFPSWLHKPAGQTAQLHAQIMRQKTAVTLYPAELQLGDAKVLVSGALLAQREEPLLRIKLHAGKSTLQTFEPLLNPLPFDSLTGNVGWDLTLEKSLAAAPSGWRIQGHLDWVQAGLRDKSSGRKIEDLKGSLWFTESGIRSENISFRLGSSWMQLALNFPEWQRWRGQYALQSADLSLVDIAPFIGTATGRMKNVVSRGELNLEREIPLLQGTLSSSEGSFRGISFRHLQSDVIWSPAKVSFENLRASALGGIWRAQGSLESSGGQAHRLRLSPRFEAANLNALVTYLAPALKDRLAGQLEFRGDFEVDRPTDKAEAQPLQGSGTAVVREGRMKDFNLIALLFSRAGESGQAAKRLPENLAAIAAREDSAVEHFKATLQVDRRGVRTDSLSLSTPEYMITGEGWVGFDGAARLKGVLLFSPKVTQALQEDQKAVRLFVDRKGRLAVPFRLDGTLPHVRIRPESRALARALRLGSWQRGQDPRGKEKDGAQDWLPESLGRLLHR